MTSHRFGSVSVVLPVRNVASLIDDCLASIRSELRRGDELVVVDDGSTDDTAAIAACYGARTVVLDRSHGPYVARNEGWRTSTNEIVCFVDSRCRPHGGWRDTMLRPFAMDPEIALVCADVDTMPGRSVAARVMHHRQPMHTIHGVKRSAFLPWFATANLAVRREALEVVGGFEPVRSGGDVDLCWRIQLHGLGRLEAVDSTVMSWVARDSLRDFLAQFSRYGAGTARLWAEYRRYGVDTTPPSMIARVGRAGRVVRRDLLRHHLSPDVAAVDGLATWLFDRELARGLRMYQRRPPEPSRHASLRDGVGEEP